MLTYKIFYGSHLSTSLFVSGVDFLWCSIFSVEKKPQKRNALNSVENLEEMCSETILNVAERVFPSFAFSFLPNQAEKPSLENWKLWVSGHASVHLAPAEACVLITAAPGLPWTFCSVPEERRQAVDRKDHCFSESVPLISKELWRREGFLCQTSLPSPGWTMLTLGSGHMPQFPTPPDVGLWIP